MKTRTLIIIVAGLLLPAELPAASIEASWDAVTLDVNGQPESISHYILYYGTSPRPGNVTHPGDGAFSYDRQVNVGNVTRVQRDDLQAGQTYYFAVAAVDVAGNVSDYSGEVSLEIPEPPDGGQADGGIDGGTDAGVDAGADPGADAGADQGGPADQQASDTGSEVRVEGGCSCAPTGPRGWFLALLLLPMTGRRRLR